MTQEEKETNWQTGSHSGLSSQVYMKQRKHGEKIKGKQRTLFRCFFTGSGFNSKVDFKTKFDQLIVLGRAH